MGYLLFFIQDPSPVLLLSSSDAVLVLVLLILLIALILLFLLLKLILSLLSWLLLRLFLLLWLLVVMILLLLWLLLLVLLRRNTTNNFYLIVYMSIINSVLWFIYWIKIPKYGFIKVWIYFSFEKLNLLQYLNFEKLNLLQFFRFKSNNWRYRIRGMKWGIRHFSTNSSSKTYPMRRISPSRGYPYYGLRLSPLGVYNEWRKGEFFEKEGYFTPLSDCDMGVVNLDLVISPTMDSEDFIKRYEDSCAKDLNFTSTDSDDEDFEDFLEHFSDVYTMQSIENIVKITRGKTSKETNALLKGIKGLTPIIKRFIKYIEREIYINEIILEYAEVDLGIELERDERDEDDDDHYPIDSPEEYKGVKSICKLCTHILTLEYVEYVDRTYQILYLTCKVLTLDTVYLKYEIFNLLYLKFISNMMGNYLYLKEVITLKNSFIVVGIQGDILKNEKKKCRFLYDIQWSMLKQKIAKEALQLEKELKLNADLRKGLKSEPTQSFSTESKSKVDNSLQCKDEGDEFNALQTTQDINNGNKTSKISTSSMIGRGSDREEKVVLEPSLNSKKVMSKIPDTPTSLDILEAESDGKASVGRDRKIERNTELPTTSVKLELEPYFKPDTDQGTASDKKTSESTTPIETLETKPNFIPDDQNTGAGKEVPISLEILEAKPDFMPGDDLDTGSDKKVPETPTILETLEAKSDIITKTMQGIGSNKKNSEAPTSLDKKYDSASVVLDTGTGNTTSAVFNMVELDYIDSLIKKDWVSNSEEIYRKIVEVQNILKDVNGKGFINSTNLLDYPLITKAIIAILRELSEKEKEKGKPLGFRFEVGEHYVTLAQAKYLYRWSYNMIVLQLYQYCEDMLYRSKTVEDDSEDDLSEDAFVDFKVLSRDLYNNLDPSIRSKLTRRGISISKNIYTGFDTEYQNYSHPTENILISVQLSVSGKMLLQIPKKVEFDFVEKEASTSRDLNKSQISSKFIKTELIHSVINESIDRIRLMKYGKYDEGLDKLARGLSNEGVVSFAKDDYTVFVFERSPIEQYFKFCDEFKFIDVIRISYQLLNNFFEREFKRLETVLGNAINLSDFDEVSESDKVEDSFNLQKVKDTLEGSSKDIKVVDSDDTLSNYSEFMNLADKKYTRTNNTSYTSEKVSVTKRVNLYLLSHYTPADLSMLKDFEDYKVNFDIVNKSFVTLKKPLLIKGINVHLRDTKLISPGKKSLEAVSSLYDGIEKVKIDRRYLTNMQLLRKDDPELFRRYALQDSLISLLHGCYMEEFNHKLGGVGIPVTLSILSSNYIRLVWKRINYLGYQPSPKYILSNASKTLTPKGLSVVNDIGVKSTLYIANYKGGRNESFMYGYDDKTYWFDVDLISAYTSAMLILGTPHYERARILSIEEFEELSWGDIVNSYTILDVKFEFPEGVKYPSIPCNVDEGSTSYPLSGRSYITGLDYLVAKKQGAKFTILEVYRTPFKLLKIVKEDNKIKEIYCKPFELCIKEIQENRSLHKKGTINNALWKEVGNSLYGLCVRGMNEKMKFDSRTGEMKRMDGNDLSNPLIASWITSFIRGVIGELLHGVQLLGGVAVSVTTDGFITDIKDFESRFAALDLFKESLYREYCKIKGSDNILEVKSEGFGIMSWCTRGQLSVNAKILAATGYQKGTNSIQDIENIFLEAFNSDKELIYIQRQLRTGKDIFTKGGNVTEKLADRKFRLLYDNKRRVVEEAGKTIFDTRPLKNVEEASLLRYISNLPKTKIYSRNLSSSDSGKYRNALDLVVRNFVRALLKDFCGLDSKTFKTYSQLVKFLKEYDNKIVISENVISQLKRRGGFCKVPKTPEGEAFVGYVKVKFPNFDLSEFFI